MRNKFAFFVLLILIGLLSVSAKAMSFKPQLERDVVRVVAGEEFKIKLESNPTTGYKWELGKPLNRYYVRFLSSKYVPPEKQYVGAPGDEIWTFRSRVKGKTKIHFKYIRPWEKNAPPARTKTFKVIIE